ncbi:MAG: phage holin family protein [Burkholderiales bacterium]|nr:phage holin family protein [Burkholderiales bacterium]
MSMDKTEKSLPTLFSDLTRETLELIRQEIALARAEVSQKISTAEKALVAIAIGAAIILAGLLLVLQAVVNGVALMLPPDQAPWLAPLLVGAIIAAIGYAMIRSGRNHLHPENLAPRRTMRTAEQPHAGPFAALRQRDGH